MNKKIVALPLAVSAILVMGSCDSDDLEQLQKKMDEQVEYINSRDVNVYINHSNFDTINNIEDINYYSSATDITLGEELNYIAFDVMENVPTTSEVEYIDELIDGSAPVIVCFFGTLDYDYLGPLLDGDKNTENGQFIANCFGNFQNSNYQSGDAIMGISFEDLPNNKKQYESVILNNIENGLVRYFQSID